jgi:glucose/galactose transporter
MGICNKVAGAISPLILSTLLLGNIGKTQTGLANTVDPAKKEILLTQLAQRIKTPYIIMAVILTVLAIMIYRSSLPEIKDTPDGNAEKPLQSKSLFAFPHLWLGVLSIFLYVGAEVMAGDAIGIYGNAMGMPLTETRYFTSFTLTAMLAGYIAGIITIPKYISQQAALKLSAILGVILTIGIYFSHGYIAILLVALLGLANALMWPAIFPLAISGLGTKTKTGSALLIMGIAGGAIIPLIFSELKHIPAIGYKLAFFICLLPAYLYILYYSIAGYKATKTTL